MATVTSSIHHYIGDPRDENKARKKKDLEIAKKLSKLEIPKIVGQRNADPAADRSLWNACLPGGPAWHLGTRLGRGGPSSRTGKRGRAETVDIDDIVFAGHLLSQSQERCTCGSGRV